PGESLGAGWPGLELGEVEHLDPLERGLGSGCDRWLRDMFLHGESPNMDRGNSRRSRVTRSTMPGEILRLAGGSLREHDIDQRRSLELHGLVERAANMLRVLDEESLAAESLHHPVVTRAIDQRVGLELEHRVFRDLRHAGADAAIVEDDD